MKVAVKIIILVLAMALAIGGVMIYAKTKVEPPVAPKQTNQYLIDLSKCYSSFGKVNKGIQEDSIFYTAYNRIGIFLQEEKISKQEADKRVDLLLSHYIPLFLNLSYSFLVIHFHPLVFQ